MDQRNKLKDTYMPDRKTQGELVVVGVSGGLKSMVAASLLKIQKYDLVAVTILNSWDDFEDEKKVLACAFTEERKEQIKSFCHHLGIPHHFIKAGGEFKEMVVGKWISDKLRGAYSEQCLNCHDLRMGLLHQKMKQLGAKHLATGHLAKVYHAEGTSIHTSNDEAHDQSHLLARLPADVAHALMLPLSDLQYKEVTRLAENFGFKASEKKIQFGSCFTPSESVINYVTQQVPAKLIKGGELQTLDGSMNFGELPHMLELKRGEPVKVEDKENNIFAGFDKAEKKILLAKSDYFEKQKVFLRECHISPEAPWKEPFKAYYHLVGEEYCEAWVYPKTLDSVYIELERPCRLIEGESMTLTKKTGKNAKIYLLGVVTYLPETQKDDDDNEKAKPKVDHTRDW